MKKISFFSKNKQKNLYGAAGGGGGGGGGGGAGGGVSRLYIVTSSQHFVPRASLWKKRSKLFLLKQQVANTGKILLLLVISLVCQRSIKVIKVINFLTGLN